MTKTYNFIENLDTLGLPIEICNNPKIAFHGTSSVFEKNIETEGIKYANGTLKENLEFIVSIYERINWYGIHRGGYPVLKPFSLMYDHSFGNIHPVFLAESPIRASLYAEKEYSGGEKFRSLRYASNDLINLYEYFNNELPDFSENGNFELVRSETNLKILQSSIEEIMKIKRHVFDYSSKYQYGIVYAVNIEGFEIGKFDYSHSMGLSIKDKIPTDALVGKIKIPETYQRDFWREDEILTDKHTSWRKIWE